jgi:hypothetical protein
MSGLVKARWVAGYPAILPNGTELVPGVSVVAIPEGEAQASDHWEPVKAAKSEAKDAD